MQAILLKNVKTNSYIEPSESDYKKSELEALAFKVLFRWKKILKKHSLKINSSNSWAE